MTYTGQYVVVRYVPDPARDEATNIGVAVASDNHGEFRMRFLEGFTGKGLPNEVKPHLRTFRRQLKDEAPGYFSSTTPESYLQQLSRDLHNSIQFTQPKAVKVSDLESTVETLYAELVAPIESEDQSDRVTHNSMVQGIRNRFEDEGLTEYMTRNVHVAGQFARYRFDFGMVDFHRYIHALPIDTEPESRFEDRVILWEGKVRDVLRKEADRDIILVVSPRTMDVEYPDRLARAREHLGAAGADTVDYENLNPLVGSVAALVE